MASIRPSLILFAGALAVLVLVCGCFAVTDLDRFHGPDDAGSDPATSDAGADSSRD